MTVDRQRRWASARATPKEVVRQSVPARSFPRQYAMRFRSRNLIAIAVVEGQKKWALDSKRLWPNRPACATAIENSFRSWLEAIKSCAPRWPAR